MKDQLQGKNAGTLETSGEVQDIQIKIPEISLSALQNMKIKAASQGGTNQTGAQELRLGEIATISIEMASNAIYRKNQSKVVSVSARINQDKAYDHIIGSIRKEFTKLDL